MVAYVCKLTNLKSWNQVNYLRSIILGVNEPTQLQEIDSKRRAVFCKNRGWKIKQGLKVARQWSKKTTFQRCVFVCVWSYVLTCSCVDEASASSETLIARPSVGFGRDNPAPVERPPVCQCCDNEPDTDSSPRQLPWSCCHGAERTAHAREGEDWCEAITSAIDRCGFFFWFCFQLQQDGCQPALQARSFGLCGLVRLYSIGPNVPPDGWRSWNVDPILS